MKKATATNHGSSRFTDSAGSVEGGDSVLGLADIILVVDSISGLGVLANDAVAHGRRCEFHVMACPAMLTKTLSEGLANSEWLLPAVKTELSIVLGGSG
jgi:hypothetical protein